MKYETARDPNENPLLEAQLQEAREVRVFLDSPAWTWVKARLEHLRPSLVARASAPGVKRDDRMLLLGKLTLVEELLARPGMLADLAIRRETAEMSIPVPKAAWEAAPQRYTPGKL